MSTTSCPRCTGQVTLPLGISNDTTVRCPLCHAQYTLADALVSAPPLLEVVEEAGETVPGGGSDAPSADDAPLVAGAAAMPADEPLDFQQPTEDEPGVLPPGEDGATDQLKFPAEDAGDDPLAVQEDDTEVEELSFSTSDSVTPEAPQTESADEGVAHSADEDELALDFGEELSAEESEAQTLEFGAAQTSDAGDEVKFDPDAPQETAAGDDATIEFDNGDGIQFEPDAPQQAAAPGQPELGEFGDVQIQPTGEAEDIPLDLPDEQATAPVAAGDDEEPSDKKKGKKKKAKATNGKPKGSALVKYGLPLIVGVPMALFVALWAGYDVAGLGGILPEFMVPAGAKVDGRVAYSAGRPATLSDPSGAADASMPDESPDDQSLDAPSTEDVQADEPPALGPIVEPVPADEAAPPPSDVPELDAPAAASPSEPADDPFAPSATPEKMPAEGVDSAADDDPFAQPESPPAPVEEPAPADDPFAPADAAPEKMPAEGVDSAADDEPFARPSSPDSPPVEPAPELPTEPEAKPEAPADDANPFGTPAADSKGEPAAEDPFAPSPAESPREDKPADLPAPPDSELLPAPAQPIEPLGPRNVAEVSPAEVEQALQATMAASQQMAAAEGTGDAAGLRKARTNFYVSLYNMANAMTLGQLGQRAAQLDPQLLVLEPMIRQQLTADPKRFESLKVFGARWFAFPKRTTNGVVLAGMVESVDQVGKLYHMKLRSGQDAEAAAVTIVSAVEPGFAAGDEVLTLGSIVENPSDQLAGYEGSEPAVVWSGMTLKIAPAGQ